MMLRIRLNFVQKVFSKSEKYHFFSACAYSLAPCSFSLAVNAFAFSIAAASSSGAA